MEIRVRFWQGALFFLWLVLCACLVNLVVRQVQLNAKCRQLGYTEAGRTINGRGYCARTVLFPVPAAGTP